MNRTSLALIAALFCTAACSEEESGSTSTKADADTAPADANPGASAKITIEPRYLRPGETRSFHVTYVAHVPKVPGGTKQLRVWLPVPQDSPVQTVTAVRFAGTVQPTLHTEAKHGNRIAYFELASPGASVDFTMDFDVRRREHLTDLGALAAAGEDASRANSAFLQPDHLTVIDDRVRKLAAEVTAGKTTSLAKARAIYDHVMGHMTYDKSGQGWGLGDTNYACDVGKGNCTDFHALFMSLARASGVPAGFEIGLYLPYEKGRKETLGGYHCWAFFEVPGRTWVPVDISEADKLAERTDYFFGGHTTNRVTLSTGRDLVLEPKQAGAPLNYFLAPYAEADGKPVEATKDWDFRDLE